jgi:hypothetical protein
MDESLIREWLLTLNLKNSEGYNRIPERILADGMDVMLDPLTELFRLVYVIKNPGSVACGQNPAYL